MENIIDNKHRNIGRFIVATILLLASFSAQAGFFYVSKSGDNRR